MLVFDENAKLKYTAKLVGNVSDIKMHGDKVYLLFDKEILRIDSRYGSETRHSFYEEDAELLILNNGDVLICTQGAAYYIAF